MADTHSHHHGHDHAGHEHGHGHHHLPTHFNRAFAIGIVLNLGFVIVEALWLAGRVTGLAG
ncbi:MAG: hypothetical protein R3E89_06640 [Thiolinea sp.]